MPASTFTLDAFFDRRFTLDAFIANDSSLKHYRDRDHTGLESDTNIVLDDDVGSFTSGTDLHTVLAALWAAGTT